MECKQANHETSLTTKEITSAMTGQTITLPMPTPIYGSLMVESTPKFCKLYIDGKDMGTTPKSYARTPDGDDWKLAAPTPGAANPATGEDIPQE